MLRSVKHAHIGPNHAQQCHTISNYLHETMQHVHAKTRRVACDMVQQNKAHAVTRSFPSLNSAACSTNRSNMKRSHCSRSAARVLHCSPTV